MRMVFNLIPSSGGGANEIYLETAAIVTTFILAGRYFEARAKRRAGAALKALLELGAKDVAILEPDGSERRVPIEQLQVGQRFIVRPGEKVATDGTVEDGRSAIDMSMLTGESVPVEVGPGSEIAGATINAGGRLIVRATKIGSDTALAQIARLVTEAQTGKAPVQRLADRISGIFVPTVFTIAVATLGFWLGAGQSTTFAFTSAVAVLIIACPCALGLATPTALMVGTGRGAQLGLLIKGPEILESTRRIDTDRARQDRHRHHRADDAHRHRHRRRRRPRARRCDSSARSRTPPSTRSPAPSPPPLRPTSPLPGVEGLHEPRGPRRPGHRRRARASSPAGPPCSPTGRCISPPSSMPHGRRQRRAARPRSPPAGTGAPPRSSSSPTRSSRPPPRRSPG